MTLRVVEHLGPDVPMHFTAFYPAWRMLDAPPTPSTTLMRARQIAQQNDVRYAYTGNIRDAIGGSTYCHQRGQQLIGREGYVLITWHLSGDGQCQFCSATCRGGLAGPPGTWGAKRQPVRLADVRGVANE